MGKKKKEKHVFFLPFQQISTELASFIQTVVYRHARLVTKTILSCIHLCQYSNKSENQSWIITNQLIAIEPRLFKLCISDKCRPRHFRAGQAR